VEDVMKKASILCMGAAALAADLKTATDLNVVP
jgi:hypothetical protein